MTQLHSLGTSIVLGAVLATAGLATLAALRAGSPWVERLRLGLSLIIGLQALTGVLLLLAGVRPRETLHLLYGAAALAILPLAGTLASEAPPRPRAWALVGACLLMLVVVWRLASTG